MFTIVFFAWMTAIVAYGLTMSGMFYKRCLAALAHVGLYMAIAFSMGFIGSLLSELVHGCRMDEYSGGRFLYAAIPIFAWIAAGTVVWQRLWRTGFKSCPRRMAAVVIVTGLIGLVM